VKSKLKKKKDMNIKETLFAGESTGGGGRRKRGRGVKYFTRIYDTRTTKPVKLF
jgi:hypothetical protein